MDGSIISINDFYQDISASTGHPVETLLPSGMLTDIGHFNVFSLDHLIARHPGGPVKMPYNRRAYFKISLVRGKNIAEYADRVFVIEKNALVFATPRIPYNWLPQDFDQHGYFCIFSDEFLGKSKSGILLDDLPIFKPGGFPVFQLDDEHSEEVEAIFRKMQTEIDSSYIYKYDLIRNFVIELIHYGQKLQPLGSFHQTHNASARVSSLFIELMERQFPISTPGQIIKLRTASDFAKRLSVHANHLNKVLKENTGKTTTEHISSRLIQEAKILLKQTDWNISEIAYSLGFEQLSHFSNFFKKRTTLSPVEIRNKEVY